MSKNYAKKGDWNVICDVCGLKMKASEVRKRWDGMYVCKDDWEPRHQQDFIKGPVGSEGSVPFTRPEGTDVEQSTSAWVDTTTDVPTGTNDGSL